MGQLEGKVAFISGIGRGQGRSHAVKLAEAGADIIGFDICENIPSVAYPLASEEDLRETERLVEKTGRKLISRKLDVRDADGVAALVDEGVAELGRLDMVLANAGIMPFADRVGHLAFTDALDVMATGVFNTVDPAKKHLLAHGDGGSIIITSSANGLRGLPDGSPGVLGYGAAKAAVVGLMRHWALELGPKKIRVNTVHPTGVNTGMVVNEQFGKWVEENPHVAEFMQNRIPVELLEPEDVSNAILFLVSPQAQFVTGQTFAIDAGTTL